jgi:hypothetical protein
MHAPRHQQDHMSLCCMLRWDEHACLPALHVHLLPQRCVGPRCCSVGWGRGLVVTCLLAHVSISATTTWTAWLCAGAPNTPLLIPPLLRLGFVGVLSSVPVALVI